MKKNFEIPVISHQSDQGGVPFVDDLRESGRAGGHQNLTNSVVELRHRLFIHFQEALRGSFFGNLNKQIYA